MQKIYTIYSASEDITFIMEETDLSLEVKGFYFGEPNERDTEQYYGHLMASFD